MAIKIGDIRNAAIEALIHASTRFRQDQKNAYQHAIDIESNPQARWMLEVILENALIAEKNRFPLCDDTGIPYVLLEFGHDIELECSVARALEAAMEGISEGLRALPGRPMAVRGNELERIAQSEGLHEDSGALLPAPMRIKSIRGKHLRIHVLMLGGGPEIRSRTYRIFHKHDAAHVLEEIAEWAVEMVGLLGCTPCVPAVGIGRTHYEATCLMLDAMTYKELGNETAMESFLTEKVNKIRCGPLGVGGQISALGSFIEIGPQRASGVRIANLRMGCSIDPRRATIILS